MYGILGTPFRLILYTTIPVHPVLVCYVGVTTKIWGQGVCPGDVGVILPFFGLIMLGASRLGSVALDRSSP